MIEFYVTAAPGTEEPLRDELCELKFKSVRLNRGGIPFFGTWEDGWRACLQTRIGQRVMAVMSRFRAETLDDIYDGTCAVDWFSHLTPAQTFSVGAYVHESTGYPADVVALKVKDAIVDSMRKKFGKRSDIDRENPDVRVFAYMTHGKATLYLDLSGYPLFKRGYRMSGGEAPLKETLAASILRLAQWDRKTPLVDPMCGSGTIVIEAALWASNVAPGLRRESFGFQNWADFGPEQEESLNAIKGELRRIGHGQPPRITGFDIDETALECARENARSAGLRLSFRKMPIRELQADGVKRLMITNPPYGVRLDADNQIYQELRSAVMRLHGWRVCMLTGNPALVRSIPRRPTAEYPLKNGGIDCRLVVYDC
ncbi:MAG: methyltransferase [Victivallales bacterium]|nr:methyltransferase [Victivallales bacterium]